MPERSGHTGPCWGRRNENVGAWSPMQCRGAQLVSAPPCHGGGRGFESLLGLYDGVALTEREHTPGGVLPDRIFIFRNPLQEMCATVDELTEEIRITVMHEIAHHFGIDDDRLHELGLRLTSARPRAPRSTRPRRAARGRAGSSRRRTHLPGANPARGSGRRRRSTSSAHRRTRCPPRPSPDHSGRARCTGRAGTSRGCSPAAFPSGQRSSSRCAHAKRRGSAERGADRDEEDSVIRCPSSSSRLGALGRRGDQPDQMDRDQARGEGAQDVRARQEALSARDQVAPGLDQSTSDSVVKPPSTPG